VNYILFIYGLFNNTASDTFYKIELLIGS